MRALVGILLGVMAVALLALVPTRTNPRRLEPASDALRTPKPDVTGRVLDQDGYPIEHAIVSLITDGANPIAITETESRGGFHLFAQGVKRWTFLEVQKDGYRPFRLSRPETSTAVRWDVGVVKVTAVREIRIRVMDSDDTALSGVEVTARLEGAGERSATVYSRRTDDGGNVRFLGLPTGQWELTPHVSGLRPDATCRARVVDTCLLTGRIRMVPVKTVTGYVRDSNGEPLAGVEITAIPQALNLPTVTAVSDNTGLFSIDVENAIEYQTQLRLLGGRIVRAGAKKNGLDEWEIRVPAVNERDGGEIAGIVTSSDRAPLAGAQVVAISAGANGGLEIAKVYSDASGVFSLTGLPQDHYTLQAYAPTPDGRIYRSNPSCTLDVPAIPKTDLSVVIDVGLAISGTLLDENDRPMPSTCINALRVSDLLSEDTPEIPSHGNSNATAMTSPEGRFTLWHLRSGYYTITLAPAVARATSPLRIVESRVPAGAQEVVLHSQRGAEIVGVVRSKDESPGRNLWVRAVPKDGGGPSSDCTTTTDGTFKLVGLDPNGTYRISVSLPDNSSSTIVEARANQRDVVIAVDLGRTIVVTVVRSNGKPFGRMGFRLTNVNTGIVHTVSSDEFGQIVAYRMEDSEYRLEFDTGGVGKRTPLGTVKIGNNPTVTVPESVLRSKEVKNERSRR